MKVYTKNYKWEMLLLLWCAYFLNQADRQIYSVVMPLIKSDLRLTDAQLGLVASVLIWTYGALVPFAGFFGDIMSKRKTIAASLLFWSIATLTTGLCTTVTQLVLIRGIATGGGEAFYAPSANTLISEVHKDQKAFALSIHQTAVYAGIILSGLIAGTVAQHFGWQKAFYLFGGLGVLIALIIFVRLQRDAPVTNAPGQNVAEAARVFLRKPTALLLTMAFACMVFVNVGYLTWMPSLFVEKFQLSLAKAGFSAMFYHHAGAFAGVIAGGFLADRLALTNPRNRLLMQCAGLLGAIPFIYWMGTATTISATATALFFFGIFRGIYDSNIYASMYEVVQPQLRSSVTGLMIMFAFLTGAFSPLLLGVLKPSLGLSAGMSWLWPAYLAGAVFIAIASAFYFEKDRIKFVQVV